MSTNALSPTFVGGFMIGYAGQLNGSMTTLALIGGIALALVGGVMLVIEDDT